MPIVLLFRSVASRIVSAAAAAVSVVTAFDMIFCSLFNYYNDFFIIAHTKKQNLNISKYIQLLFSIKIYGKKKGFFCEFQTKNIALPVFFVLCLTCNFFRSRNTKKLDFIRQASNKKLERINLIFSEI
jgi:hypothetical protein